MLEVLEDYDFGSLTLATVCSHSSLQIFHGARVEGFRTLGICVGSPPRFYDAFPRGRPDSFFRVESYPEILERVDELAEENVILIPHGSFVEYLGSREFARIRLPTFGNRRVLEWESDRERSRRWLESAGISMPRELTPDEISGPVIVKYHGAKGGRGFFIARTRDEFYRKISPDMDYTIQEFVTGNRYYFHYFYSPLPGEGYQLTRGRLELLGMDRRIESNVDELYRLGPTPGVEPSFVVTGNLPLVARESLLTQIFEMGERVTEKSLELFGGMIGPFCLETICTPELEFKVFEVSARIVAGTNLYISGSPYADLISDNLSTGRRIAREIKNAMELDRLEEVVT